MSDAMRAVVAEAFDKGVRSAADFLRNAGTDPGVVARLKRTPVTELHELASQLDSVTREPPAA